MTELIMEVNENNEPIGLRPREDFYTAKYMHRGVQLILRNTKGEILVQKRAQNKVRNPGKYSYSAGGTVGDETCEESILRETKEEIGIEVQLEWFFEIHHTSSNDNVFQKIFLATIENEEGTIVHQKEEVDSVEWIPADKIRSELAEEPDKYSPLYQVGMKIYFDEFHGK